MASRFVIETTLGSGVSGVVYRARRIVDDATVALKVIHPEHCGNPQIFGRFHREATILKRLEGPHVVKLLDFVEDDGLLMIALEYIDGRTLEAYLGSEATMSAGAAIEIGLQVCAALGVAHAAGVVHRDLKPGNVILEEVTPSQKPRDGAGLHVRVVDFGLAKVVHGEHMTTGLTEKDMIFGTAEYMAPEQARGEDVDPRTDIYALGVMLYEMVVGRVPFSERTPILTMTAHLGDGLTPPRQAAPERGIAGALEAVILRCLNKEPRGRFASARELAEALIAARTERIVLPVSASHASAEDDFAIGDTALNVDTSELSHSPTLPSPPSEPPPAKPSRPAPDVDTLTPPPPPRTGVWLVVAVLAAAVAVVVGVVVGAR